MRSLAVFWALALCGCTIFELRPSVQPLEKKVLEGEGAAEIAVVGIDGMLTLQSAGDDMLSFQQPIGMVAELREQLDRIARDDDVEAIIIKINSPGGSVAATEVIYHELLELKRRKEIPMVAALMGVAASGGYYIACAADRIVTHPATITGSIGVLAFNVNASELLHKIGVENETLTSGTKKDMLSPLEPYSEAEREVVLGILERLDAEFENVVKTSRQLSLDQLNTATDGRIIDGERAVELDLADQTGYLDDAIAVAKERANLEAATVITYARPSEYKDNVYSVRGPVRSPQAAPAWQWLGTVAQTRFMYLWMP